MITLAQAQNLNSLDTAFVRLVDQALSSPALIAAAVAAAVGVGAVHALTPGHGKAIGAAYLVGGRGRFRDAVLLGVTVAAMHTASVLVLAGVLHLLLRDTGGQPSMAGITPVMRVVSGVLVLALGLGLLISQWRRRRHGHDHDHALPPEVSPFSRRGLVLLGMSGGLLPSPAAFLVLITAWFSGKGWLGLLLVLAFSIGLAATLTVVGVAAVRGRELVIERMAASQTLLRRLAVGAAAIVALAGLLMTTLALRAVLL